MREQWASQGTLWNVPPAARPLEEAPLPRWHLARFLGAKGGRCGPANHPPTMAGEGGERHLVPTWQPLKVCIWMAQAAAVAGLPAAPSNG